MLFVAVPKSAFGTKQTRRSVNRMSAFGAKRTSREASGARRSDDNDPEQTSLLTDPSQFDTLTIDPGWWGTGCNSADRGGCRVMTVVIVGAGSAGLSVSRELRLLGVEHVVLERNRMGQAWRDRWDSFTLVTPNWTLDLPGGPYAGSDPEGHVPRDEIVSYLEDYGANHAGTIRESISVHGLDPGRSKRFRLDTSEGSIETDTVVVCSGAYQRPHRPAIAAGFPS